MKLDGMPIYKFWMFLLYALIFYQSLILANLLLLSGKYPCLSLWFLTYICYILSISFYYSLNLIYWPSPNFFLNENLPLSCKLWSFLFFWLFLGPWLIQRFIVWFPNICIWYNYLHANGFLFGRIVNNWSVFLFLALETQGKNSGQSPFAIAS